MSIHFLLADDEPAILASVSETLSSHGYTYDQASDFQTAQALLSKGQHQALVLDMNMPLKPGGLNLHRDNGCQFLARLRKNAATKTLPVIIYTGQDGGEASFIGGVFRAGGIDHTFIVQKNGKDPLGELNRGLEWVLNLLSSNHSLQQETLIPFRSQTRRLVIFKDRVTLQDIEVWNDRAQDDMRKVLLALAQRSHSGVWKRIRGVILQEELDRSPTNPIGKPIKSFRDRCTEQMLNHVNLDCGKFDVIAEPKGGGYHFPDWIEIVIDGENEVDTAIDDPQTANSIQTWILQQIDDGEKVKLKDVLTEFSRTRSQSQIKRDIKEMRDQGIIESDGNSCYRRCLK